MSKICDSVYQELWPLLSQDWVNRMDWRESGTFLWGANNHTYSSTPRQPDVWIMQKYMFQTSALIIHWQPIFERALPMYWYDFTLPFLCHLLQELAIQVWTTQEKRGIDNSIDCYLIMSYFKLNPSSAPQNKNQFPKKFLIARAVFVAFFTILASTTVNCLYVISV